MSPQKKERWIAIDDIPGIAARDEIIIVKPRMGILITRWMPLSKYSDLMEHHLRLSLLVDDKPYPYPPTAMTSSGSPVSELIKADSDQAALFELIHSAGGRMPPAAGTDAPQEN